MAHLGAHFVRPASAGPSFWVALRFSAAIKTTKY
jgi:hypothetical protein